MALTSPATDFGDFDFLVDEFAEDLHSGLLAGSTIACYRRHVVYFGRHLRGLSDGRAWNVAEVTREDVVAYLRGVRQTKSAGTLLLAHIVLRRFFAFLVEQKEIAAELNPMAMIVTPKEPPMPDVPLLPGDTLERMVAICRTIPGLWGLRDETVLRFFWDTPARCNELASVRDGHIDLATRSIAVLGKGNRPRVMRFGKETARVFHRYMRMREALYKPAWADAIWISKCSSVRQPALKAQGLYHIVRRVGRAAGLGDIHPHQFRHTFADRWLEEGGGEVDLMTLCGWTSPKMLIRYGRANARNRALGAYDRILG